MAHNIVDLHASPCRRVMTMSFHKWGNDFFPGTGALHDVGEMAGRYTSVNVPLRDGTDDATFLGLFQPIVTKAVQVFKPGAIVMQCGATCRRVMRRVAWQRGCRHACSRTAATTCCRCT